MVAPLRADNIDVDIAILVNHARSGDSTAFGQLYVRHAPLVRAVLLAHAPPDDVPDLAHDTYLLALKRISDVREPGAFAAWLASIARNVARAHRRSAKFAEELSDDIAAPVESRDDAIECARVLRALKMLPENLREPLLLRLVEGMTGEEIAASLGVTHGSVRVNLHRGLKLLRQKLEIE
jgi:RNA polymerase sigma-70 factor (ECF subfamily)